MKDKYSATWVSHSSLSDFLKCPRAYYLNNVYKDPQTGHKITLMQPSLALGQAIHAVIESLSTIPTSDRFRQSLLVAYETQWEKVSGKRGGFVNQEQEQRFKERGAEMLRRIMANPGPLTQKAVKINKELPYYWISEEDNIILCGRIDWLIYYPQTNSVGILDFKTGKYEERAESLQLAIYCLLVKNCQKRPVTKAFYWYIDRDEVPKEIILPDEYKTQADIIALAKRIKVQRQLNHFKCQFADGCSYCQRLERIIQKKAEPVGVNDFGQDIYILPEVVEPALEDSFIL